jgi:hypothetical protein
LFSSDAVGFLAVRTRSGSVCFLGPQNRLGFYL